MNPRDPLPPEEDGCFTEMTAFLTGERLSHPGCAHPLLAEVALLISEQLSESRRHELLDRVPDVIGTIARSPVVTAVLLDELVRHRSTGQGREIVIGAWNRAREHASAGRLRRAWLSRQDRHLVRRGVPELLVPLTQGVARNRGQSGLIALMDDVLCAYRLAVASWCTTDSSAAKFE